MSHTWTPRVKQWVALGLISLGILILRLLWQYLTPLALALLLTFILNPVVNFVERRTEWPRVGATGFVYLILILLLLLIPLTVAPIVVAQLTSLAVNFADVQEGLLAWVNSLEPFRIGTLVVRPVRWVDPVLLQLESLLPNLVPTSVDLFFGVATTFVASLFWLVFILVISFYLVRDAAAVRAYLLGLVPPAYMNDATVLIGRINSIWHSFLRGQVVLSIVIGTAVTVALLILGVPNALLLGLLAGILEMIPNVGPFIAMVPALLIALFNGSTNWELSNGLFALLVIATYTLIQQVENNYLVPRIIGRSVHLHPVVILLGAIAGASIGGILGIFLAAPVLASLRVLAGYAYWKLLEPEESEALPARTELNDVPVPNVSSAHVPGVKQRPLPPEAVTPEPLALDT